MADDNSSGDEVPGSTATLSPLAAVSQLKAELRRIPAKPISLPKAETRRPESDERGAK
jgi:hypothetical protein